MSFEQTYGEIGSGFIHVHHNKPISEAKRAYEVDPVRDLTPLCPNCHAMVHRRDPPLTVSELRALIRKS